MSHAPPSFERNLMIVANAGSGKTHRLVTRCIQLLQRQAKPEEILALTFTRAAAAEFLQKLFERLAQAAVDPAKLADLQGQLGPDCPPIDAGRCTSLLRALVQALPRLSMGTLDQYFHRIVRAFPFELGLSGEVELLDEAGREEIQSRTLSQLFASASDQRGLGEFIELLRRQSRNRAEQSALKAIASAVTDLQEHFIETPRDRPWGRASVIWPSGCALLSAGEVSAAAENFAAAVRETNPALSDKAWEKIQGWLQLATQHRAPLRMDRPLQDFLKKLTDDGLGAGKSEVPYIAIGHAKLLLHPAMRAARDALFLALGKVELLGRLEASMAIYELLDDYEEIYQQTVRQTGQLTFSDLASLLARHQQSLDHQHIEYRLDGRHSHWLLDEFQDTSRLQWRIMEPLADNVVCEDEGRSFFYVGDTKQAIYGWRGGDFELFQQVHDNFRVHRGVDITREDLPDSWRSDGNIVEVINAVFAPERFETAPDFKLPAEAVANWRKAWVVHRAREERRGRGLAQLRVLEVAKDGADEPAQAALDEAVLEILREVDPVGRGISCAIIARTRKAMEHYVDLLRGQNPPIPVAAQGRMNPCLKSPEGLALFALAKFLASPLDRIAAGHFLASPFGFLAGNDAEAFHLAALRVVAGQGLAAAFTAWVREAGQHGQVDATKAEPFLSAAADYETRRQPGADLRAFVDFIDHRIEQESETPGVVRVMTTHFSKGLGMDMVILPELGGTGLAEWRDADGISVHRDSRGGIQWGLALPRKEICAADPTLAAAREHLRARQAYENFCVLYVAMTRAKHALYCLHAPTKDCKNAGRWLQDFFPRDGDTDSAVRTIGNPRWFESRRLEKSEPIEILGHRIHWARRPIVTASPSAPEENEIPAGLILRGEAARHLGTEVHALLAQVEWLGDQPDYTGASESAAKLVRAFLSSSRAGVLRRPEGTWAVWREKAFDVELDGQPASGVFDRVHLMLGADGKPTAAQIYDFKTDRGGADFQDRYREQLQTYKKAAAALLQIAPDQVSAEALGVRDDGTPVGRDECGDRPKGASDP